MPILRTPDVVSILKYISLSDSVEGDNMVHLILTEYFPAQKRAFHCQAHLVRGPGHKVTASLKYK